MQADYIYPKFQKMVSFNDSMYKNLAQMLIMEIGDGEFFNGKIEMDYAEVHCTLKTTLIVYREKSYCNKNLVKVLEDSQEQIKDIIPVWWEMSASLAEGVVNNDFSWREFKEYLF